MQNALCALDLKQAARPKSKRAHAHKDQSLKLEGQAGRAAPTESLARSTDERLCSSPPVLFPFTSVSRTRYRSTRQHHFRRWLRGRWPCHCVHRGPRASFPCFRCDCICSRSWCSDLFKTRSLTHVSERFSNGATCDRWHVACAHTMDYATASVSTLFVARRRVLHNLTRPNYNGSCWCYG